MNLDTLTAELHPPGRFKQGLYGQWSFVPTIALPAIASSRLLQKRLDATLLLFDRLRAISSTHPLSVSEALLLRAEICGPPQHFAPEGIPRVPPYLKPEDRAAVDRLFAVQLGSQENLLGWLDDIHRIYVEDHDGFRQDKNVWIKEFAYGSIILAAPPPEDIADLLSRAWECCMERNVIRPEMGAILMNYFIIAVHPFNDGNGRLGSLFVEKVIEDNHGLAIAPGTLRRIVESEKAACVKHFHDILRWGSWRRYLTFWLEVLELGALSSKSDLLSDEGRD